MKYAKNTEVPVEKSQVEIKTIVTRYGATKFASLEEERRAAIMFEANNRRIRFILVLPDPNDDEFYRIPRRHERRSNDAARRKWEQACRQRWRALALAIKAKLEAVESGIATFEEEFLPYTVMPDGMTVAEHALPAVAKAYLTGSMPPLLPAIGETGVGN